MSKKDTIIVVDDSTADLMAAASSLAKNYDVFTASSGKELFSILNSVNPDLILLDAKMPEMDGYAILRTLKDSVNTARFPVILICQSDPESEDKGLNLGAADCITKPFSYELLKKRIKLHISVDKQKKEAYDNELAEEIGKKTRTINELQNAILGTLAELVECRDSVTGGHIGRTQHYLSLLVGFLLEHDVYAGELLSWDLGLLIMSSQLHDVGKIAIKDDILMKSDELTGEEFEEMKRHTLYGADIIKKIEGKTTDNEFLYYAEAFATSHHEKWDGTGYPYGLAGLNIPLQGRLMAVVDVYDSLTNERPYKRAYTHEESVRIIRRGAGTHFDPSIIEIFLQYEKEFQFAKSGWTYKDNVSGVLLPHNLSSALMLVSNILDIHGDPVDRHASGTRHYLRIFVNHLASHEKYKHAVSEWNVDLFLLSAQLHDVGEIAVCGDILNKVGELTEDEFEVVKTHADFGAKIIQQIKNNVSDERLLSHAEALVGSHHEKWDGTGYPLGLKGTEIPLQARIMAIVDTYDALLNDRPYRIKKSHVEAIKVIKDCSGTHFDPELVDLFFECEKAFLKVEAGRVVAAH